MNRVLVLALTVGLVLGAGAVWAITQETVEKIAALEKARDERLARAIAERAKEQAEDLRRAMRARQLEQENAVPTYSYEEARRIQADLSFRPPPVATQQSRALSDDPVTRAVQVFAQMDPDLLWRTFGTRVPAEAARKWFELQESSRLEVPRPTPSLTPTPVVVVVRSTPEVVYVSVTPTPEPARQREELGGGIWRDEQGRAHLPESAMNLPTEPATDWTAIGVLMGSCGVVGGIGVWWWKKGKGVNWMNWWRKNGVKACASAGLMLMLLALVYPATDRLSWESTGNGNRGMRRIAGGRSVLFAMDGKTLAWGRMVAEELLVMVATCGAIGVTVATRKAR